MFNFDFSDQGSLPEELALRVFGFFGCRELLPIAKVSRDWNRISSDNSIWRNLLIQDFHFTTEIAEALRARRGDPAYKALYHFCKSYRLNGCCLEIMCKNEKNVKFSAEADLSFVNKRPVYVLIFDTTKNSWELRCYSSKEQYKDISIIHEVNGLDALLKDKTDKTADSRRIKEKITSYEYEGSTRLNSFQTQALQEFQGQGITAEHLRGRDWFDFFAHIGALRYLLNTKHLSAADAMQELDGLTCFQAQGIAGGLSRQQVLGLNPFQTQALQEFQGQGITAEHLRGRDWFDFFAHIDALRYLLNTKHLSAADAMQELNGLTCFQAQGIAGGLSRQQVLGLNPFQTQALQEFQGQGITAEHLRGRDWFDFFAHIDALRYLLNTKHLSAADAMQELDGLTYVQAQGIAGGLSRQQGLGLNLPQTQALQEFQSQGITAEHLRGRDWFDFFAHIDALRYLLNTKHLSAADAMQELDGLTCVQAQGIAGGLSRQQVLGLNPSQTQALQEFQGQGITAEHYEDEIDLRPGF